MINVLLLMPIKGAQMTNPTITNQNSSEDSDAGSTVRDSSLISVICQQIASSRPLVPNSEQCEDLRRYCVISIFCLRRILLLETHPLHI